MAITAFPKSGYWFPIVEMLRFPLIVFAILFPRTEVHGAVGGKEDNQLSYFEISPFGVSGCEGLCLNNEGSAVCVSDHGFFIYHANNVEWVKKVTIVPNGEALVLSINSINDKGEFVGVARVEHTGVIIPFLYSGSTFKRLEGIYKMPADVPGFVGGMPYGINNDGMIVGSLADTGGCAAYLLKMGVYNIVGASAAQRVIAFGLNSAGKVVGVYEANGGANHAFFYNEEYGLEDLGTLGGKNSYAKAVNAERVVGVSELNGIAGKHGFVFENSKMRDIGTLGGRWSDALAINRNGDVVGSSSCSNGELHAFLYRRRFLLDLTLILKLPLTEAVAINDQGQVLANAKDGHVYLLTPR